MQFSGTHTDHIVENGEGPHVLQGNYGEDAGGTPVAQRMFLLGKATPSSTIRAESVSEFQEFVQASFAREHVIQFSPQSTVTSCFRFTMDRLYGQSQSGLLRIRDALEGIACTTLRES